MIVLNIKEQKLVTIKKVKEHYSLQLDLSPIKVIG